MTARVLNSAHTNISAGTTVSMTFEVGFICDVEITGYTQDLSANDTYILSIDGVDVSTVVVSGPGSPFTFPLAASIFLSKGIHTFKVRATAPRAWFHNSTPQMSGDAGYGLMGVWQESNNNGPHCNIYFNEVSNLVGAGATPNNSSSSNYAAQSSSLTVDQDIYLYRWFSIINNPDQYTLWIDGTIFIGAFRTTMVGQLAMFEPATPVLITSGTHTFVLRGTTSRKYYYRSDVNKIGSAHLTATTVWVEAGGTTKPQLLFAFDTNTTPTPPGSASGVLGFL